MPIAGNMQKIIADVKAEEFGMTGDLRVDGIYKSIVEWHVREMVI